MSTTQNPGQNDVNSTTFNGMTSEEAWQPSESIVTMLERPVPEAKRPSPGITLETGRAASQPTKPLAPLTRKQAAFVRHLIENPKASATRAVKATYGKPDKPVTELAARSIAHENIMKPNIQLELAKHSATAELAMLEVLNYSKEYGRDSENRNGASYASVAVSVAKDILDRVHGKATQRVETTSTAVVLNIDLTKTTSTEAV